MLIFKSSGNCAFSRRIYRRAATRPVAFYYPLEKSRVHRGQYHTVISIDNTFRTQSHTTPRTKYTTAAITPTNALKTYHSTGSPRNSIYSFKPISICMRRVKDEKKKTLAAVKKCFHTNRLYNSRWKFVFVFSSVAATRIDSTFYLFHHNICICRTKYRSVRVIR